MNISGKVRPIWRMGSVIRWIQARSILGAAFATVVLVGSAHTVPSPSVRHPAVPERDPLHRLNLAPDSLHLLLDSLREASGVPGAAAAIVTDEGVVWSGVAGLAAPSRPLEPGMIFETGSMTKPFTAGLVLTLATEGVLSLDDPLTKWLPDFPHARGVTVRQLLQHTSGLHDYTEHPDYLPALRADFTKVWKPEDCTGPLRPVSC